jgi:hypothetical protein
MKAKPKISANGTYILDPEDIEQLDELSLTSVISDVVGAISEEHADSGSTDVESPSDAGDTTINRIPTRSLSEND